jgi:predicted RNase H-like HicB family nuclease
MSDEASVRIPVTVTRNPGSHKSRRYTASYGEWPRAIEAEGASAAEAKERLTGILATALDAIMNGTPRFARDDDGAFMVAVPSFSGGSVHWRVRDDVATLNTFDSRPASEAFSGCYHMTVIPSR